MNASRAKAYSGRLDSAGRNMHSDRGAGRNAFPSRGTRIRFPRLESRSGLVVAAVVLGVAAAAAQTINFDARPTGFLKADTGGMPSNAWSGTTLGTAKRLVSSLSPAPRSR